MEPQPEWMITAEQLQPCITRVTLVDVRDPEEYRESRIEGCKHIPLGELQGRASELKKEDDIVIYCAHGVRSLQALMALKLLGFEKLRSLRGGIAAWQEHLESQRKAK